MKWLTRSIVPSMVALAVLIGFFRTTGPRIVLTASDFKYSPQPLVVHVGDTVAVRNAGRATHTFNCVGCAPASGNIQPGTQKAVKFAKAGSFLFFCLYHRDAGMVGTIVVLNAGEATPAPNPSTPAPQASA